MNRLPLSKRRSPAAAEAYDALHDGIPDWIKPSVGHWIDSVLVTLCQTTDNEMARLVTAMDGYDPNDRNFGRLLQTIERTLRVQLNWSSVGTARDSLIQLAFTKPTFGLDLIDLLLGILPSYHHAQHVRGQLVDALTTILDQGHSKYCVSATYDSLEERVATEVAARAAGLMTAGTRVAHHLREAWHAVYGRNPNPSHAYREAIRAVEVAAIPVVSPKNTKATLGTVIADMKNAPQKRAVALQPAKGDPVQYVIGMMELLWTAQIDRHGNADESVPLSVSREEAEAAVHLALTLTHWFQTDLVR